MLPHNSVSVYGHFLGLHVGVCTLTCKVVCETCRLPVLCTKSIVQSTEQANRYQTIHTPDITHMQHTLLVSLWGSGMNE